MPPNPKTIVVTGANRGIGLAICRLLLSKSTQRNQPLRLWATSRAGKTLDLDPGSQHEIHYPQLDISSSSSIASLASQIREEIPNGRLDVLINNAGVNLDNEYGPENARRTLEVNCWGTLEMCRTFLPLLKGKGLSGEGGKGEKSRIVTLSSVASSLNAYSPDLQTRFRSASTSLTLDDLSTLSSQYLHAVSTHSEETSGFGPPGRSYSFSKALVNAFTLILARENPDVLINCCCPGWVATEMGKLIGKPPKREEDGAKIPVRLAVGDIWGVTGGYWANGSVRSKEEGELREW
ncbi:uncharacterized protein LTR77_001847 [Saxophila tyrrhenica]|uniref:NAD(P)-binding protein n=1 Tax=Saxophila tyrrhenica TaxID=1690608 RepID=A0AAV9PMP2_9PEZI|nr:hypothetical protein LTR77_001847 [Saxophila tyrrhenica]